MGRKIAVCFVLIVASTIVSNLAVIGAEPIAPPQKPPHPASGRSAALASRDVQEADKNAANRELLEYKLAERDRLQREIDDLGRKTGTPQQILVRIRAIEINRSMLRRLGVDWATADGKKRSVTSVTDSLRPSEAGLGDPMAMSVIGPGDAFHKLLRALETANAAKVLAEPSIVTVSGRPASFHVGGEFPVPAGPNSEKVVEFVDFGTKVDLVTTSLGSDKVRMELRVRLSDPDYSRTITVEGRSVPTFNVRQLDTACELPFGQSAVFTGFVDSRVMTVVRADGHERQETEEIETLFLATPEVVAAAETIAMPELSKAYDAPTTVK